MDEYGDENGEEEDHEKDKMLKDKPVMPEFNREEFLVKWLEDNPPIEIPESIIDDKDNDWYMNDEEEEALISAYFQAKNEGN